MTPHDEGPGLQDGALAAAISPAGAKVPHRHTGCGPDPDVAAQVFVRRPCAASLA